MKPIGVVLLPVCLFAFAAPEARAQDRLAWRQTRTAHCVFIYRQKDEAAARELAGFAEDVYSDVTRSLDNYPGEVRSLVLGDVDEANGMYSAPPHHLELYVRAPSAPWMGARGSSWLKLLFTHELTHYVDMDADEGFFFVLSLIFGEGVKSGNSGLRPAWTYEGLAVLLETELTAGGRGRNPFFLMYAKAFLADDVPFSLGNLEYASAYPPPNRYYLFGYLFLDFLKLNYGPDVFRDIRRRFLAFPLFGPWGAIRAVTGHGQDELWREMRAFWKAKLTEGSPAREGNAVTPAVIGDYSHPIRTAGGLYAYRTRLDLPPAVVALDPDTQTERTLFEEYLTDENSFCATPDGKTIVFASTITSGSGPSRERIVSDLSLAEIAGAADRQPRCVSRRRLTHDEHLWHPALSADGGRLAAVQGAGAYSRLVLVDQATGKVSVLFAEESTEVYNPVFSPDGKRIAFVLNRRGIQDIYLIDADSPASPGEAEPGRLVDVNTDRAFPLLGNDEAGDYFPRFVDDDTVLFTSDREGFLALYEASPGKRELVRVCSDRIAAYDGVVAEGGLVYTTYRGRGGCLKRMPAGGLERVAVIVPPDTTPPPPPARPEIESSAFVDWPGFQFWLPYGDFLIARNRLQLAFGVYVLFASYLDTNGFDLSLVYFPTFNQPEANFNFSTEIGPLNLSYSFAHTFAELGAPPSVYYREDFRQTLSCELPLVDRYAASGGDYWSVSLSVGHDYLLDGWAPFAFLNGFSPSALANGNYLSADLGLFSSHAKYAGPAAFYPPWSVVNAFDAVAPIPVLDETRVGVVLIDRFFVTLPGLWNLSAFRIGLKADYETDELLGSPWVSPRGFSPDLTQAERGRGILMLDWLTTIAYTDAPLPGGFHFDGLGAGLHFEVPFDWDVVSPAFTFDRYFYLGVELVVKAGLGVFSVPIGLGVTMRLDWGLSETPDINDFAFYYFLSFNSFWSGAREKPPLNRRFR